MKNALLATVAFAFAVPHAAVASSVDFEAGETEVVVAADAPKTVLFAAEEMTNFLSRAFDSPVPIVTSATPGRKGIYLGDSDLSRKAGIDVSAMKRDAFAIVCEKGRVFIAGRDDPNADTRRAIYSPHTGVWAQLHEHATLFGVYEFLERYAGVRMYFPGELGTIVPKLAAVVVPEGRLDVAPAFLERNYSAYTDGPWYEGEDREKTLLAARKLNYTRNRMQTLYIPCCHGTRGFDVQRRFAKEHPEYMALFKKKGEFVRDLDPDEKAHHPGQLCHSSAVYDEFFEDIRSYARGDGPEVRGVRPAAGAEWPRMTFRKPWVDVMPQDGYVECQCEKCQAAYDKGRRQYATGLIWGRTVGLANRLSHRPNQLSGGQQQRVAIARALATDPVVILADEPTGNLDTAMSVEIMGLFTELNRQGKTIVMVTHEEDIAAYAGHRLVMRDGLIKEMA